MESSIIDSVYEIDESINDEVYNNKDYRKASERALKCYEKLRETLTDEQKDDFEKFIEQEAERTGLRIRISFKCGVKYGARFVSECMFD